MYRKPLLTVEDIDLLTNQLAHLEYGGGTTLTGIVLGRTDVGAGVRVQTADAGIRQLGVLDYAWVVFATTWPALPPQDCLPAVSWHNRASLQEFIRSIR